MGRDSDNGSVVAVSKCDFNRVGNNHSRVASNLSAVSEEDGDREIRCRGQCLRRAVVKKNKR